MESLNDKKQFINNEDESIYNGKWKIRRRKNRHNIQDIIIDKVKNYYYCLLKGGGR